MERVDLGCVGANKNKNKSLSHPTKMEDKLSFALNEAITLNQMAAKELERGEEFCLKARREGLEPINNDIAAAEVVKDMAEHERNHDMKGKLEEQAMAFLIMYLLQDPTHLLQFSL